MTKMKTSAEEQFTTNKEVVVVSEEISSSAPTNANHDDLASLIEEIDKILGEQNMPRLKVLQKLEERLSCGLKEQNLNEKDQESVDASKSKLDEVIAKQQSEIDKQSEEFKENLQKFLEAVEAGQTKQSLALYEKCQSRLHRLGDLGEEPKRIEKLTKNLRRSKPVLDELKAWRSWSMNRAREELITKVEGYSESKLPPKDLLIRIRDARDQWNKWNQTGDYPNRVLRQRFEESCKKAFAPCAEYLKEQRILRQNNLETRNQICEELADIFNNTNWNRPDWVQIGTAIRNARKNWKAAVPLSKNDWRITNEKFDQILKQYEPYLSVERERCHEYRLQLIERVKALNTTPLRESIETVKQIQQEWKNVTVRCSKQRENQLWEQFRLACDQQFDRRTAQREAVKQRQQNQIESKKIILDELKSINANAAKEMHHAKARVSKIKQQWNSLDRAARRGNKSIDAAFDNEVATFERKLESAELQAIESTLMQLEELSQLCMKLENVVGQEDASSTLQSVQEAWGKINKSGGAYQVDIDRRFQNVCTAIKNGDSTLPSTQENLVEKEQICLQLEILSEIPSPPEFARDRMEYQVTRLNASMTKQQINTKNIERQCQELVAKFFTIGAVPPQSSNSLQERFSNIRSQMKSKDPS